MNDPSEAMKWEPGTYGLNELIVLRPTQSAGCRGWSEAIRRPRCRPHARFWPWHPAWSPTSRQGGFGDCRLDDGWAAIRAARRRHRVRCESTPTLELPAEYWREVGTGFEARPGQVNEWTIPLPDELIKAVREASSRPGAAAKNEVDPRIASARPSITAR